jgi:fructokinase
MIIVAGENVADLLPADDGLLRVALGGGPANTAVAAARLGAPVAYPARFGVDALAERFRARLAGAGVDLTDARVVDAPSALALATIDALGVARYDFWLDGAADFAAVDFPEPADGDIVHTGSLAAYWPPGADVVEGWLSRARDRCTVTLDVNLRPVVLARQPDARERLERLVRLAHVVKASDEDVAFAYPGATSVDVARSWLAAGAELVVMTHGADGASAHVAGDPIVMVPAPTIVLADTIGAGDAAMAALLAQLAGAGREGVRARLPEVLRFVCAAAAIACTRPGAYAPEPDEVAALLEAANDRAANDRAVNDRAADDRAAGVARPTTA